MALGCFQANPITQNTAKCFGGTEKVIWPTVQRTAQCSPLALMLELETMGWSIEGVLRHGACRH